MGDEEGEIGGDSAGRGTRDVAEEYSRSSRLLFRGAAPSMLDDDVEVTESDANTSKSGLNETSKSVSSPPLSALDVVLEGFGR